MKQESTLTFLEPSDLLDYHHPTIEQLILSKGWNAQRDTEKLIKEIYCYVRDEIPYGYTKSFSIPASAVLAERHGDSITKSTLFMALLRAVGVPCRFYAMTKSNVILRGLLPRCGYTFSSKHPYFALVEIKYHDNWIQIEGYVTDKPYIRSLQKSHFLHKSSFYGYGIATVDFYNLAKEWKPSLINKKSRVIIEDFGSFPTPDLFFSQVPEAEGYTRSLIYKTLFRPSLNKSIQRVRKGA